MAALKTDAADIHHRLQAKLTPVGLSVFGWFDAEVNNRQCAGLLVGNRGRAMWEVFSNATEYQDGKSDPMDRWTMRILSGVELSDVGMGIKWVFPFQRPYLPFQRWAKAATGNQPSRLGMLIDPEFGLWQAYRGALLFHDEKLIQSVKALNQVEPEQSVCANCEMKPCLSACPVDAFSHATLQVEACFSHLDSSGKPRCLERGCQARAACPVGQEYRYSDEQTRFHMTAFCGQPSQLKKHGL